MASKQMKTSITFIDGNGKMANVKKESDLYNKDIDSRWAHMIIHSMLHIQGYTHEKKND